LSDISDKLKVMITTTTNQAFTSKERWLLI